MKDMNKIPFLFALLALLAVVPLRAQVNEGERHDTLTSAAVVRYEPAQEHRIGSDSKALTAPP